MPNTIPGLSRFRQGVILSQHRIEEILLASLSEHPELEIQREVVPDDLVYIPSEAESEDAYPITVSLRWAVCEQVAESVSSPKPSRSPSTPFTSSEHPEHGHRHCRSVASISNNGHTKSHNQDQSVPDERKQIESINPENGTNGKIHQGGIKTVKARYMIGCDGAHSWTRSQLGIKMNGEHTDFVWGVIDIIPITDFPDIRSRCAIHSAKSGSIMIIPREGGRLIRIYCQLNEVSRDQGGKFDRSEITEERIFKTAQKIMRPYALEYKYCENWTVYQVSHSAKD
jgi:phenol 2-monooxygenase